MSAQGKFSGIFAAVLGAAALVGLLFFVQWNARSPGAEVATSPRSGDELQGANGKVALASGGDSSRVEDMAEPQQVPVNSDHISQEPDDSLGRVMGATYGVKGDLVGNVSLSFYQEEQLILERKTAFVAMSDEDGFYRSKGVPAGRYLVAISRRVDRVEGRAPSFQVKVAEVEIWPGQTSVCDVVVEGGRTLSGRYTVAPEDMQVDTDMDGRTEPRSMVVLISLREKRYPDRIVAFTEAVVYPEDYEKWRQRGEEPGRDAMRLTPEEKEEWARLERARREEAESNGTAPLDPNGYFRFEGIPPSEYVIRIQFAKTTEGDEIYLERFVDLSDQDVDLPPEEFHEQDYMQAFWARMEARNRERNTK